jgi:hypothetical protein
MQKIYYSETLHARSLYVCILDRDGNTLTLLHLEWTQAPLPPIH